ncbi:ferrochelatase [Nitrosomonas marina]|uniref:Ferrochelatase n=1 Tax=Nitrosomonas marina TaxID=917 RepID=A0A1H9Z543_9PROT|nr:ferrochelatase [Nitrosomonas marina]SES76543.1 ferrochelatase [Nitrosomonas marina]
MSNEPEFQHGTPSKTGVLLINLGTPDAPTKEALRPYLREFLSNPRVIEVPRLIWWPILYGFILPFRPKQSAEKYALIWTSEGSPLKVHTERQTALLAEALQNSANPAPMVEYAMNIGNPSVASVVNKMAEAGCDRILIIPLFPQYAASSTAAAMDAVFAALGSVRNMPAIRTVKQYHDHSGYIAALAQNIRDYWEQHGQPDKLIISFHGVPRRNLDKGDPYHCFCQKTGRLLAEALNLGEEQYQVCFQSRFGRAQWLQPYTAETLEQLGKAQTRRVDITCPGFVSDCLETLEEIAIEGKKTFTEAGGKEYHYIPCLNERADWIDALSEITRSNLQGWLEPAPSQEMLEQSKQRALAMGAHK